MLRIIEGILNSVLVSAIILAVIVSLEIARRTMFLLLMLIVRVRLRWTLIRSIAITIVSAWLIVVIVTTSFAITPPLRLVVSLLLF